MATTEKSLVAAMHQVQLAIELIELGARLQLLETETDLSRGRLLRLYKEIRGISPPKGMLPFSTEWFLTWGPNIHSSLFYNIYHRLTVQQGCERIEAFVKAYRLYLEQVMLDDGKPLLGLNRAWTLLRFFEGKLLDRAECTRCHGHFVIHAYTPCKNYVCGICHPPSRAGKTLKQHAKHQPAARDANPGITAPARVHDRNLAHGLKIASLWLPLFSGILGASTLWDQLAAWSPMIS